MQRQSRSRLVQVLVATIIVLVRPSLTAAQRTALVPPPIRTPELMTYADLIGLSDQQRLGLLPIHDQYKERYAQFEAKDVKKLQNVILDIARRLQPGRLTIPPREELEDALGLYKRVLTGAHAVDRSLFDELAATLTEQQALKLTRARTARELATYRVTLVQAAGNFNPGAGVDLADELPMEKLSPEEKELVDQILVEYEAALLSKTRTIYSTLTEAFEPVLDLVDELRLREMTVEAMMQMMQDQDKLLQIQSAFDEASKPFQAAAYEVSQLNLKTSRRLSAVMSSENAREFREGYLREAYSPAAHADGGVWSSRFHWALALLKDDLSAEQVQQIETLRDEYHRQRDAVMDTAVAVIEASREYRTFMQLARRGGEIREAAEEWSRRFESISKSAVAALDGVIGPELAAEIDKRQQARKDEQDRQSAAEAAAGAAKAQPLSLASPLSHSMPGEVPGLPQVLAFSDLEQLSATLKWDDEARTVLGAMYDEYRESYDSLLATPLLAADAAAKPTVPQEIKAFDDRYAELAKLDQKLFDDAEVLASTGSERRMIGFYRDARTRRAAARCASRLGHHRHNTQAGTDPLLVAAGLPLSADGWEVVAAIDDEHGASLAALAMRQLKSAREEQRVRLLGQRAEGRDDKNKQELAALVSQQLSDLWAQMEALAREIAQLNRRVADELTNRLPADDGWSFKIAYQKTAYPDQYYDYDHLSSAIDEALQIAQELTSDQREAAAQLKASFQADYFTITERIIELDRLLAEASGREARLSRGRVDNDDERRKARFDRDELGARTRMRLRMLLPPEVVKRVRALA